MPDILRAVLVALRLRRAPYLPQPVKDHVDLFELDGFVEKVIGAGAQAFADAGAKPPEPVARVEDLKLDLDTGLVPARVYAPESDTTPPNFEEGVMDVFDKSGAPLEEIEFLAHGTTVVINALTERKGVTTALITTEGFRDSLEIARGNRPDYFNLHYVKPAPFVPRRLRREVQGRLVVDGKPVTCPYFDRCRYLAQFRPPGTARVRRPDWSGFLERSCCRWCWSTCRSCKPGWR